MRGLHLSRIAFFDHLKNTVFVMAVWRVEQPYPRGNGTSVCGNLTADKVVVWFFGESMFGRMAAVVQARPLFSNTAVYHGRTNLTIRR
jgi:hypothetical protein